MFFFTSHLSWEVLRPRKDILEKRISSATLNSEWQTPPSPITPFSPISDQNRGERIVFLGPNTNTNTIRFRKFCRIRIQILFGFRNMAEYEYEYYSGSEIFPNTNTNTIRKATFVQIRIQILRLFE